ncbi:MAG TPA: Rne/Rng family ribonuclease [Candidatus Polarisedimenticolaceae bacterium]|nr:Rne/Rng family ribonuclease [Candidatus Polarisedimenticolaceae bacterium]
MSVELFASRIDRRLSVAVREDGRLVELRVEPDGDEPRSGRILRARVTKVLPGLEAAFVDVGGERGAFLHASELPPWEPPDAAPPIERRLHEGQVLTVQVEREAVGEKGARLTCRLALPGPALVLLPGVGSLAVSRRIPQREERARLSRLLEQLPRSAGGWIARTAASGRELPALAAEAASLVERWRDAQQRAGAPNARLPVVLLREPSLLEQTVQDIPADRLARIVVDDETDRATLLRASPPLDAALARRIETYAGRDSLFANAGIDAEIDRALRPRVWLRSGGYIVIEETEALVSIDVNTAKHTGRTDLEQTVLETNLEAADEVARQLRLRGLGGIIVIDMIDMSEPDSRQRVVERFRRALLADPARTRVVGLSELGLLELTRQSKRPGLARQLTERCGACNGSGRRRVDRPR